MKSNTNGTAVMYLAHELFAYETGTGYLIRKKDCGSRYKAGEIAGTLHPEGYVRISVNGRLYLSHRLIFLMHFGRWPHQIDHINGIRDDNRWLNLRDVSSQDNSKNKKRQIDNKSGTCGVCWHKNNKKWQVHISVNGQHKHLGHFENKEDAIALRKAAEIKHGYHPNHGRTDFLAFVPPTQDNKEITQ